MHGVRRIREDPPGAIPEQWTDCRARLDMLPRTALTRKACVHYVRSRSTAHGLLRTHLPAVSPGRMAQRGFLTKVDPAMQDVTGTARQTPARPTVSARTSRPCSPRPVSRCGSRRSCPAAFISSPPPVSTSPPSDRRHRIGRPRPRPVRAQDDHVKAAEEPLAIRLTAPAAAQAAQRGDKRAAAIPS